MTDPAPPITKVLKNVIKMVQKNPDKQPNLPPESNSISGKCSKIVHTVHLHLFNTYNSQTMASTSPFATITW